MQCRLSHFLAIALGCTAMVDTLSAVDGVILIDQSRALAGNVTPGDSPGFPVTITQPGSYRLSSNLMVSFSNSGIYILASHVTIDLNGFAILGNVDCSGGSCLPTLVNGYGIFVSPAIPQFNISISNGTIQGMGEHGISLTGGSFRVEKMFLRSNGKGGLKTTAVDGFTIGAAIIRRNTAERNGGDGFDIESGLLSENLAQENKGHGINLRGLGRIERNTVGANGSVTIKYSEAGFASGNVGVDVYLGTARFSCVYGQGKSAGDNLCLNRGISYTM